MVRSERINEVQDAFDIRFVSFLWHSDEYKLGRIGYVTWWPLLGLLSWYPLIYSSHCNSFEDRVPVDGIYGYPIFKWVTVARIKGYQNSNPNNGHQGMPHYFGFVMKMFSAATAFCEIEISPVRMFC